MISFSNAIYYFYQSIFRNIKSRNWFFFQKIAKKDVKCQKWQQIYKNSIIFYQLWKGHSNTCDYYMHDKPTISPACKKKFHSYLAWKIKRGQLFILVTKRFNWLSKNLLWYLGLQCIISTQITDEFLTQIRKLTINSTHWAKIMTRSLPNKE